MNTILILHASGTNRDSEAQRAVELAGGAAEIVHVNQLRADKSKLADYAGLLLPGGFSYGDALGAGARLALDLQVYFHDQLSAFVQSGKPVLGICNGFQTLVKAGILPGSGASSGGIDDMARRRVTLTENAAGHFECRWVHLAANRNARSSLLAGLDELIFCPVAHGEGNFQGDGPATVAELENDNLIAFRYVTADGAAANGRYPFNPNGSAADIAGICNKQGNVLGLMPHPEDYVVHDQNPLRTQGRSGLPIFRALVDFVRQ